MSTLAEATLTESERRALESLVLSLAKEFGHRLRSVWLYGSRARGERPHPESDVDLLLVLDSVLPDDSLRAIRLASDAERAEKPSSVFFSTIVYSTTELAQRREIESFFIREVDRDKIVLFGDP